MTPTKLLAQLDRGKRLTAHYLRAVEDISSTLHTTVYCPPSRGGMLRLSDRGKALSGVRRRLLAMAEEIEAMRLDLDRAFEGENKDGELA